MLGRATSTDGETWTREEASLYGSPDSDKVSHPTAHLDEAGIVSLWHLNSAGQIALSVSADGTSFTPACVPSGRSGKSPEVVWHEDRYLLFWASQQAGEDVIFQAESYDGLRWSAHEEPILRASDTDWTADGLSNAQLVWIDDAPRLLLVGVEDGTHRFGLARPVE